MSSGETTTAAPSEGESAVEEAERDEFREHLLSQFADELGDAVVGTHIQPRREAWLRVNRDAWQQTAEIARHKLNFAFFDFLSAIDWLPSPFGREMDSEVDLVVQGAAAKDPEPMTTGVAGGDTRFQVFARVCDLRRGLGVICKADLPDDDLRVDTWSKVYAGADWHERETWEMYGIQFTGHPHLEHLYLPSDFEGHPLRKDFPLLARRVKPWPGIVDVEPMPGSDEQDEGEETGS